MVNSTDTYWDIDGVSLNTLAFNIQSWGGDRLAPPTLRGSNLLIPHTPGRVWMPKVVDQRVITLAMWVIGADEDGNRPTSLTQAQQFDDNFRKLRNLLWQPHREFVLTKRFYVNGVLKTASAKAQFSSGLNPSMNGRARGVFTVDVLLADPYFYGTEVSQVLTTGTQSVSVDGDDRTQNIKFTFNGSRSQPKVRNNTLLMDFEYDADINSGGILEVEIQKYKATATPSGGAPMKATGLIRHSGGTPWFSLAPGANSITLSSDSGSGVVTMAYKEAWL